MKIKNSYLILNSKGEYFNFFINEDKILFMNQYNEKGDLIDTIPLKKCEILDFAVKIDIKDNIHLIYLKKNGELVYSKYSFQKWNNKLITIFDINSNIYKQLKVHVANNMIYILYASNNLINKNIWSLELITDCNSNSQTKRKLISFVTSHIKNLFSIDYDCLGNIHIAYSAQDKKTSHIYYIYYNIYTQSWHKIPTQISDDTLENEIECIYADTKDNIHILWYSKEKINNILYYKRFSTIDPNKYSWAEIVLPTIKNTILPVVMFEKKDTLNIAYINEKHLNIVSSKDFGLSWDINDSIQISDTIDFAHLSYNYNDFDGKITDGYWNIDCNIFNYLTISSQEAKDIKHIDNIDEYINEEFPPQITATENEINLLKDKVEELYLRVNKLEGEISNIVEKDIKPSFINKLSNIFK